MLGHLECCLQQAGTPWCHLQQAGTQVQAILIQMIPGIQVALFYIKLVGSSQMLL